MPAVDIAERSASDDLEALEAVGSHRSSCSRLVLRLFHCEFQLLGVIQMNDHQNRAA